MLRWLLPQANPDLLLFTVTPTAASKTVTLNTFTAPFGFFVDWGDGTLSAQVRTNTPLSHTYADTKAHQIAIHGQLGGFWNTTSSVAGKTLVTSVDKLKSGSLVTLANTFRNCTALKTLPTLENVDTPELTDCTNAFYGCASVTSSHPYLWQAYPTAKHSGCFYRCFKSMYAQYGTNCSKRQNVPAVTGETYYEHYGTKSCPAATYHAGTAATSYYNQYGTNCTNAKSYPMDASVPYASTCGNCGGALSTKNRDNTYVCTLNQGTNGAYADVRVYGHTTSCPLRSTPSWNSSLNCENGVWSFNRCTKACKKIYSSGSAAYYSCSHFNSDCKGSSCTRTYKAGSAAYTKCTRMNSACSVSSCPYPYANESSYNAAKAAGWA